MENRIDSTPNSFRAITLTLRPRFTEMYPDPKDQFKMSNGELKYMLEKHNFSGKFIAELTDNLDVHYHGYVVPNRKLDETRAQSGFNDLHIDLKRWPFGINQIKNRGGKHFLGWYKYMSKEPGRTRSIIRCSPWVYPASVSKAVTIQIKRASCGDPTCEQADSESDDEKSDDEERPRKIKYATSYGIPVHKDD